MNIIMKIFISIISIQKIYGTADFSQSIKQYWSSELFAMLNNQSELHGITWKDKKIVVLSNRLIQLFSSKSKKVLQVQKDSVNAKGPGTSIYSNLSIESISYNLVRIRGIKANRYICFNFTSKTLIVQKNGNNMDCVFEELHSEKSSRTYFKAVTKKWYIAIKKNGNLRPGYLWEKKIRFPSNKYGVCC